MSGTHGSRRLALAAAALALMPVGAALGGQDRGNELLLKERRISVAIDENLAILTYSFSVLNPTARLMEGQVTFDVPSGATGCELTLLRNISSRDRAGRIMEPKFAAAVYEAVRKHDLSFESVDDLSKLKIGRKGAPVAAKTDETSAYGEKQGTGGLHSEPSPEPEPEAIPEPSPESSGTGDGEPRSEMGDPALLELVSGDTYRLRFFPVPAYCDETVTATFAVELRENSAGYALKLPLTAASAFAKNAKTVEGVSVSMATKGRLTSIESGTHAVPAKSIGGNCAAWTLPIDGKFRTFQLAYALDAAAKPWDFGQAFTESLIVAPGGRTVVTEERAFQAVLARRLVAALGSESASSAEKARGAAAKAKIVTSCSSLMVVEQWQAAEASKGNLFRQELLKEELEHARSCDYVRRLAGLPKVGRGDGCVLHLVQTSSADRIEEAKKKGWRTWASKELPTFTCIEYVKHGPACAMHDGNPSSLSELAKLMEK